MQRGTNTETLDSNAISTPTNIWPEVRHMRGIIRWLLVKLSHYPTVLLCRRGVCVFATPHLVCERPRVCRHVAGDLSSCSDASCHCWKWPESLCGVLLQTSQEAAGLAKQVGASGVGLLTLLWRRSGCGQIVTTHIHTVWFGPNTMVFVCGEC